MLRLILPAMLLVLAAAPVAAQEAQCFQNEHFLVIFQDRTDEVGSDFIIRPPALGKVACTFETRNGDIRIGEAGDPLHFLGLAGPHLILSRSTGPDGDLVIYDLERSAFNPFIDVRADDEVTIETDRVVFWERTMTGTETNCPEFSEYTGYGLGAVIAEERVFEVETRAVTSTGKTRCSSTQ